MRWWYLAASAGVLMVVSTVVLSRGGLSRGQSEVPSTRCPGVRVEPAPGGAETAGLQLRAPPSIQLEVDGHRFSPGLRLSPGHHRFRASAPGLAPFEVTARVSPFSPVLLEAALDGPVVVAALLGAPCESCSPGQLPPVDGVFEAGPSSLDESAAALARGDTLAAARALRRVPLAERGSPRVERQLEAIRTLSGAEPRSPALLEHRARQLQTERPARSQWRVARWNASTERFQRLLGLFTAEANGVLANAGERFDALSQDLGHATDVEDEAGQERALTGASLVEQQLAENLAALHPADCAWVARVQAAFAAAR